MKLLKKTKKGFTLVEVIVVVAVLAVLAAIAIPVVTNVIGDAKTNADNANAKTIETAIKLYMVEHSQTGTITGATVAAALYAAKIEPAIKPQGSAAAFVVDKDTWLVTTGAVTTEQAKSTGTPTVTYANVYVTVAPPAGG